MASTVRLRSIARSTIALGRVPHTSALVRVSVDALDFQTKKVTACILEMVQAENS